METRRQPPVDADQLIIDNMQLGLLVYQLEREEDDRSLRVTRINPSAARLIGRSEDEALGQYIDEIFPALRESGLPALFAHAARTGQPAGPARVVYEDDRLQRATWSVHAFALPDRSVGVTFENINYLTSAERDVQRQLRRLASLRSIDLAILGSLDIRLTLQVVLDQATTQLGFDAGVVLLYSEDGHSLELAASRGFRNIPAGQLRLGPDIGLPGRILRSRATVVVHNLSADEVFVRSEEYSEEEFISYCGAPLIAKGKLVGVLELFHREVLRPDVSGREFFEALAGQAAIAIDNAVLFERLQETNAILQEAYEKTLEGWMTALELRDWETSGHTRRVTDMAVALAREMGVRGDELAQLRRGALLHDIGKIGVPDCILRKPGPLDPQEWEEMRKHPKQAYDLLAPVAFLKRALDIPRYHHERWDGKGYPSGLQGTAIPLAARIFSVVDAWDAMRSDRPYRTALPEGNALARMRDGAGSQFDPQVVEAFLTARIYEMADASQLRGIPG